MVPREHGGSLILPLFGDDNPTHYFHSAAPEFVLVGPQPSHAAEWDWDSETGQFWYTPAEGFNGVAEFQYKIVNGPFGGFGLEEEPALESNVATVKIYVGSGATVHVTPEERPDDDPPPPCDDCSAPGQPNIGHNTFSGGPRSTYPWAAD